jgi:hypothetical protein
VQLRALTGTPRGSCRGIIISTSLRRMCVVLSLLAWVTLRSLAQSAPPSADTFSTRGLPRLDSRIRPCAVRRVRDDKLCSIQLVDVAGGCERDQSYPAALCGRDVYELDTGWNENTLGYNTAPTIGPIRNRQPLYYSIHIQPPSVRAD